MIHGYNSIAAHAGSHILLLKVPNPKSCGEPATYNWDLTLINLVLNLEVQGGALSCH